MPATLRNKQLPAFIPPMLAQIGTPFDSDNYLFEVKWDGTRSLAFLDGNGYRLVNRRRIHMTERYPEFNFLAGMRPGTVLDGEIVVLKDGKPSFQRLQSREHTRAPLKIRHLARTLPATYVVFDLLYAGYESMMAQPLTARRERLQRLVQAINRPELVVSEGFVGHGNALFRAACEQGLEGVVAKPLSSRYWPGKRSDAWLKIKRSETLCCLIIGFVPAGRDNFRSLILASLDGRTLRCVGRVGGGFDFRLRAKLNELLYTRLRSKPIVPCRMFGKWVEPDLYCTVSCLERTASGELRAPVFRQLHLG